MAEGFGKEDLRDEWEVKSAGIEAHGVNPLAIKAMKELGIDISSQTSDKIDYDTFLQADFIVTLCGDAADKCPMTPPHIRREHWRFVNPAKATGSDEEKWLVFQRARDEISKRVEQFSHTGN